MTVDAIKAAIEKLPEADRREIADWLDMHAQEAWDAEMERDLSADPGDRLFQKVNQQIQEGQFTPMDWEAPGPRRH